MKIPLFVSLFHFHFVDEGGGVEVLAGGFRGHARGELSQLVVDERPEIGRSLAVTDRGCIEEAGHIGHDG